MPLKTKRNIKRSRKNRSSKKRKLQKGGMFSGNFNTYLDYISPDTYITYNLATGTGTDPTDPHSVHDARLDPQVPITPVSIRGGGGRRKGKGKRKTKKMRGGQSAVDYVASPATFVSDNPAFAVVNANNADTLAELSAGSNSNVSSNLSFQPVAVSEVSHMRSALV